VIARKPKKKAAAGKFIAGAGRAKRNYVRVITNFDQPILERIDAAANADGLTRSAFIVSVLVERLRQLESAP
jgi:hypothetical protein